MPRVLFVFLDGVGLGADDPSVNPLVSARLPAFEALLGGRRPTLEASAPVAVRPRRRGAARRVDDAGNADPFGDHVGPGNDGPPASAATLVALDATLGVDGLPQSGTGHASLLTGGNAAERFGRHYGPWVPTALRPLVRRESLLARAVNAGLRVAFANAYPEEVVEGAGDGRKPTDEPRTRRAPGDTPRGGRQRRDRHGRRVPLPLRTGPPLAALGAGLLTRHTAALARGDAVASEITNDGWREHLGRAEVPRISPGVAGRNLARIAAAHDLTLYAHYATDTAGHRRDLAAGIAAIERVDAFLAGLLDALPGDVLLVVASDHGNLEDARHGHTRNPALGLVAGPGHVELAGRLHGLTDVAGAVLAWAG